MGLNMNTANRLTLFRILLVPFFVILLIYGYHTPSLLVFSAASLSDALDGLVARKCNQMTRLGSFLDPMADKTLLVASFVTLAILRLLPGWFAVIAISRDLIIVVGAMIVYILTGNLNFSPTILGKAATMFQILTIAAALLGHLVQRMDLLTTSLIWVATLFTIVSGFQYVYIGMEMFNEVS